MKSKKLFRISALIFTAFMAFVVISCEVEPVGNVTPTADLVFIISDDQGHPVEGAIVYIFPYKSSYDDYVATNPDGNDLITPSLPSENVAVSSAVGQATFINFTLEGNSYASGSTYFNRPNPLYFRIQATVGGSHITNDTDLFKITFNELESGEHVVEEIPVALN
ncbi:MAG: hypothetical protein SF052_21230 [Bacteroidia bacterium]|nr:hypothetical protein [Bacteroidia bacterium]